MPPIATPKIKPILTPTLLFEHSKKDHNTSFQSSQSWWPTSYSESIATLIGIIEVAMYATTKNHIIILICGWDVFYAHYSRMMNIMRFSQYLLMYAWLTPYLLVSHEETHQNGERKSVYKVLNSTKDLAGHKKLAQADNTLLSMARCWMIIESRVACSLWQLEITSIIDLYRNAPRPNKWMLFLQTSLA